MSNYVFWAATDQHWTEDSPITHFTETGIAKEEKFEDFDIVAICTGYDAVTGGLMTMNIKGDDGVFLHDKW